MFPRVQSEAKNETADPVEVKPVANDGAFVSHMEPGLDNVIRQALEEAQAAGKAHMSQTVLAVQAVQRARSALPREVEHWSLTTLREKLVKIGAKVVRHGRYVTFQLAEVAVPRSLFRKILSLIYDLRRRPAPA